MCLRRPEPIYSTAHPDFEGEDEGEGIIVTVPVPAGDEHVDEGKVETPVANDVSMYAQKGVFFVVILAVVAWFIRRSRTGHKIDEKSMA